MKYFEVAFCVIVISFLKNESMNLFLIQLELLAQERKHVVAPTSHEVHCIKSYLNCDFHRAILTAYQHWMFIIRTNYKCS